MAGIFGRPPSSQPAASVTGDLSKDVQLSSPPEDSISGLSWSPAANHLAVSSWDSKVRIYDVTQSSQGTGVAAIEFTGPVLGCDWSKDGSKVVGAGADKTAKLLDLGANGAPAQQIAVHDAPIRCVRFCEVGQGRTPMVITGSWDKTVKYWDMRTSTPACTIQCQDRVYAMDVKDRLVVVGTAERHINTIDLDNPSTFSKTAQSPLKQQTRALSCFKDSNGFMVGSIEGRCAFHYINDRDASLNMSFKCHRDPIQNGEIKVWTINAISTHPIYGTFATGGSDGTFHFWDKDAKSRLKGYPSVGGSISATAFNQTGDIFAYAVSYDWHKGFASNSPGYPNKVMLHPVVDEEVRPKGLGKKKF